MRTCISCGETIEGRRKDAKFCQRTSCRVKAYRNRQGAPVAEGAEPPHHKAAAVLSCECGRRYLLEVRGLDGASVPILAPVPPASETVTPTVRLAAPPARQEAEAPSLSSEGARNCSEQFLGAPSSPLSEQQGAGSYSETVLDAAQPEKVRQNSSEQIAAEPPGVNAATSATQPDEVPQDAPSPIPAEPLGARPSAVATNQPTVLELPSRDPIPATTVRPRIRTVELLFQDESRRRIPLCEAVYSQGKTWYLRSYAATALGIKSGSGTGLAGTPGRWEEFYPGRSPTEYGFDATLAVLFWDDGARRAYAADVAILQAVLGHDWKDNLRALCAQADAGVSLAASSLGYRPG